jgi:hypothetical protein
MECPKCHFTHPDQITECMRCGLVFAKYVPGDDAAAVTPRAEESVVVAEAALSPDQVRVLREEANREFMLRVFALPGALLLGWAASNVVTTVAEFLHMWTHESGHAVTAWFCGYPSLPSAWWTNLPTRQRGFSVLLAAGVVYGAYVAWQRKRWFWVTTAAIVLVLLIAGASRTEFQATGLVYFGGDAGAFVLSTVMMASFYARRESAMTKGQVRWGLLVLGATAFMYGYTMWAGGYEKISSWLNDTDERGPSDLQMMTQMYGWGIGQMQSRFLAVAHACFTAMAAMYAGGLWTAWQRKADAADQPAARSAAAGL